MTPLEFFISVKNSEAKNGLEEVQQKVDGFKASTDELYQGPAREMRIRTEIKGVVQDIAMGQSPLTAFLNSMERLSEMGKFAGGLAAMVALLAGIVIVEVKAEKSTLALLDAFKKAMSGDTHNMTLDQLKETQRAIEETEEKLKNASWLQKLMSGGVLKSAGAMLTAKSFDVNDQIDQQEAAQIRADTARIRFETDARLGMEAEIAAVKEKYQALQAAALAKDQYDAADAYGDAMLAEIDKITAKAAAADEERVRHLADLQTQLDKARAAATAKEETPADRVARYSELGHQIDDTTDPEKKLQLQIEQADLAKQIAADEARGKEQEGAAARKTSEEIATSESATAKLKQEILKAQFESLDKEDQIIVRRAALANLEKEIKTGAVTGDDALRAQLEVMRLKKELADADRKTSPFHGIDADTALRGNMASGSFGRVTNDAANRAEKQRDDMVGYLKTIAQRGGLSDLEAF